MKKSVLDWNRLKGTVAGALMLLALVELFIHFNKDRQQSYGKESSDSNRGKLLEKPSIKPLSDGQVEMLRQEIKLALNQNGELPLAERRKVLGGIAGPLSPEERQALLYELMYGQKGTLPAGLYTEYFQEICLVLGRDEGARNEFAGVLGVIASDPKRDPVLRDYSTQHLRMLWEGAGPELRSKIKSSLKMMVRLDAVISPSALLSLHVLGCRNEISASGVAKDLVADNSDCAVSDGELSSVVSVFLTQTSRQSDPVTKLAALRVIREREMKSFIPELHRILDNGSNEHVTVKMAAVAALSVLGDADDLNFICSLDRKDHRLNAAVEHALSVSKIK